MSGYDCRNKCVLSFFRNTGSDGADVMSSGRALDQQKQTIDHPQSPDDGRTSSWLEVDDRSRRRDGMSATVRYRSAVECSVNDDRQLELQSLSGTMLAQRSS